MVVGFERTNPGVMQFTVMPYSPSSYAVWRVKEIWAALAAEYDWTPVRPTLRPAPEEMFTIRPQPAVFMPGTTARVQLNVLVRFASKTMDHCSSVMSSIG